ncbi:MAG: esterase-like activity of phytase family protein [Brevundimonas diminuta]|uniref:esterase-like activity of phytase family protein n=1 Tax=Brevundimonas diminuta TaxID=293 RepID=UPI0028A0A0BF|nr:esterase-like activity of phytase family protein [Brevundimonas diminuta]MBI2248964.1 esterase-like activity of phytase family protein [Brevundimonas diminuta]
MNRRLYVAALISLALAACAGAAVTSRPWTPEATADGWAPAGGSTRQVGLGWPGGARLAKGVRYAGGVQLIAAPVSSLHGLSDLKLTGDGGFVAVSDSGDLVRGRLELDADGKLSGLHDLRVRRLTTAEGEPIADKAAGDAEGLALGEDGEVLVSFEREHRIWSYGPLDALSARPQARPHPAVDFPLNEGLEALATAPGGWRVGGEGGGVWDCSLEGCRTVIEPTPAADGWRLTGLERDPGGDGWFAVQRSWRPPFDVRARVRRMDADGALGPVLVELKLPGLTDNFEGIAAERRAEGTRLYILSDDNANPAQKTLMLAFDVR